MVIVIPKVDKVKLIKELLYIDNKNGQVVPFDFHRYRGQLYFSRNKTNRNIILKHRQGGWSSSILADMFTDCITIPHTQCAVVSHETRATQRLLDRVQFFYDSMKSPKPEIGAESRSEKSFPELHSSIYIGTAGARAFGRGDTIRKALLCLHPESLILLAGGKLKKISEIIPLLDPKRPESGDRTYSAKTGNVTSIKGKYVSPYSGIMIEAVMEGNPATPLIATPEHKVLATAKGDWQPLEKAKWIGTPIRDISFTKKSLDLKQHGKSRWNKPLTDRFVPFGEEFGWIIGLFLAEGSFTQQGLHFTLSIDEGYLADKVEAFFHKYGVNIRKFIQGSKGTYKEREIKGRSLCMQIYSTPFRKMFMKILSKEKVIPDWFWNCGRDFLVGVADGYITGNGDKKGYVTSVRPWLLYQLRSIQLSIGRGYSGISWSDVRKAWTLYPLKGRSVKFRKVRGKSFVFVKIQKKKRITYTGDMYDIETRGSFMTPSGIVHNSELAFYEDGETILNAVEDAVPLTGELTLESTPNGENNIFYDRWVKAKEGKSPYKPFFFPWWWTDDYQIPRDSELALPEDRGELSFTGEELELIEQHHLSEDQIRWRRWKISEKGGLFWQEYPEDEVSCFFTVGDPVFDSMILNILAQNCYDGTKHPQGWVYWIPPQDKVRYTIGADSSAGAPGGSYSAAVVLSDNWEVCATFQARLEPHTFAGLLKQMGIWYNQAEIVVERNFTGYAVLAALAGGTDLGKAGVSLGNYPNLYRERDFLTGKVTNKLGWWTSDQTKQHMMTKTKDMLSRIKVWDINLVRQMKGYRYIKYKPTSQTFDDLAMALMLAIVAKSISGGARGYMGNVPGYSW